MSKTALLIIDVQNDYFEGGKFPLHEPSKSCKNIENLVSFFRKTKKPIVYIKHFSIREGSKFLLPDTYGSEIHSSIKPNIEDRVIIKNYPNSFYKTELHNYLQTNTITDLVICGMMTQTCVDSTVRAAKDYGYKCELINDACATKDLILNKEIVEFNCVQTAFMAALSYYYADIYNTNEYLEKMV